MADSMRSSSWGNGASDMNLNDLLERQGIDPARTVVLRHRPTEPSFNQLLPWIVAEHPSLFDTYQRFQVKDLEKTMAGLEGGHVASFLRRGAGAALFVGLFRIGGYREHTHDEFWAVPENARLREYGMRGFPEDDPRPLIKGFELSPVGTFYRGWIGRMVVGWPPPERSWWRRAHKNEMPLLAILEESELVAEMPGWERLALSWQQLSALPQKWRAALTHWRAIYYIFDRAKGRGYVGSAYGADNLLSRWTSYAKTGHGDNVLLKACNPSDLVFTILQRVSPDMAAEDVVAIESSWKARLHTRQPYGLNAN